MRETPQLKHIEQVSDGWIKKYILTYVLPDGSDYIYEAASRKGLEAYRAELARLEAHSNTAIAAIDEGADDFGAAAVAAAEQAAGTSGKRTADAVSIVPITRDGNLVLIREFRYPLNSWVVGLPAGLVEPGEDLAVAVDRELREETGYGLRTDIPEGAVELLPQADSWQRVGFSSGRILLGFVLGAVVSVVLAVCAARWSAADALLAPVMQLVKATPVASFIILALVWVRGASLSVLISFLMVLPVLYGAVRTGIQSADPQLLEMTKVFRLPLGRRLRAVWLPAVLPAFRQGCSVALGICWKSGVAAEVIGLPNGSIGDALYRAKITLSTGELFAWTFVIILLSAGFEKLFLLLLDCVTRAVTGEVPQC